MSSYDILAFTMVTILLIRMYLSYRMDRLRRSTSLTFKFLFGAYAIDAVTAVLRKAKRYDEARLKRISNRLFLTFWTLFIALMLAIAISN